MAAGLALGLFWAMMPMPFQMLPAGVSAFFMRVNIPAAISSVWITNPITFPFVVYWQYRLGAMITGSGVGDGAGSGFGAFILGCAVSGLIAGLVGWLGCHALWGFFVRRAKAA